MGVIDAQINCVGFTLAELLAVIVILGVIALIAFPAVNKAIKNSKEKAYETQKEIILSSAKNWGLDNINHLSETEENPITISTESSTNYICTYIKDYADNTSETKCAGPYKLDKTDPDLTVPAM